MEPLFDDNGPVEHVASGNGRTLLLIQNSSLVTTNNVWTINNSMITYQCPSSEGTVHLPCELTRAEFAS
jgi:hypothetical protein